MTGYRIDVIETALDKVVHTQRFDATALEAEQKLGDVWNSGPYGDRFKAVLTIISGDGGECVWQEIDHG